MITQSIVLLLAAASCIANAQLEITNPLNTDRTQEVIELPMASVLQAARLSGAQAKTIVATDAATGKALPSQLYASKSGVDPDTFLLLVTLKAHGKERIVFKASASAPKFDSLVFGRPVPERKDDFAWENQLVTYRIYGPALQATGEVTSGIDVWSKRIPNFIIDDFYRRDAQSGSTHNPALSYHKDNGIGLDSYDVGPTPGCGGTAVYSGGKLLPSKNYTSVRILSSGPLRFAFEVVYAPWDADGVSVAETKQIILDAGSHLNRIRSVYTWQGTQSLELAAGVTVHKGAEASIPVANAVVAVWDIPQDPTAGHIATGLLALSQQHAKSVAETGHDLLMFSRRSGEPFTYYAGSGWSKSDMPTQEAWAKYLTNHLQMLEHPLILRWKAL